MNSFSPPTPRVALGIAAAAMTIITFGLLIVVPATIESGSEDGRAEAMAKVAAPEATEVAIIPARIEVIGVRKKEMASALVGGARFKRNHGG